MKVKDIAAAVEAIAPKKLAQDWDNTGLLVGNAEQTFLIPRVLILAKSRSR